jgi:hypothetical protein
MRIPLFGKPIVEILLGEIRLKCRGCDDNDLDFIANLVGPIKQGWDEIVDVTDYPLPSPYRWWTHIGTCPQCMKQGRWR